MKKSMLQRLMIVYLSFVCFPLWSYELQTLYGTFILEEEILQELLESPAFKRLEKIHQYGVDEYVIKKTGYTRAEHSIGVLVLLKRYGAPLTEQIAGLLHDVSHTVFSHVGDLVFDHEDGKSSYQDDNHLWFLEHTSIPEILQRYHFSLEDIHHKDSSFSCLEACLPQLCADRLEYNLMGGYLEGLISKAEILTLLDNLHFEKGVWFFDDVDWAKRLGELSLYLTVHVWADSKGKWVDYWTSQALKRALAINYLTLDDIHFGVDDEVWDCLLQASDGLIQQYMYLLRNYEILGKGASITPGKFRGIDPLVKTESELQLLTALDASFKEIFETIKKMYPTIDYTKGTILLKRYMRL